MPTMLLVTVLIGAGGVAWQAHILWQTHDRYQHLFDTGGTSKYFSIFCIPKGSVGSKGELVPDKTLEIAWYQHLLDTGGTSKYFSIFCIPKGTVGSKGEPVPDKTLEIALYYFVSTFV